MDFHLVVRTVHVVAATLVVGGTWGLAAVLRVSLDPRTRAAIALRFEWLFWGAFVVLVATGVGNAGVFGSSLPPADTRWGAAFTHKLGAVVVLGTLSMVRTLAVARHIEGGQLSTLLLPRLYAWSAGLGTVVVVLAEVLAHGG